jgi:hypothetical protein
MLRNIDTHRMFTIKQSVGFSVEFEEDLLSGGRWVLDMSQARGAATLTPCVLAAAHKLPNLILRRPPHPPPPISSTIRQQTPPVLLEPAETPELSETSAPKSQPYSPDPPPQTMNP